MPDVDRFFVVTGGPGSGKTTLIEALARNGIATIPKAGRAVIRDQVTIHGDALPWANSLAFAEAMIERDTCSYHEALSFPGPVFFDRGVPDVVGYLRLIGLPVPPLMDTAARRLRYNYRVFVAPPWPAIYARDAERKQSIEEAEATCRTMVEVYSELGYELITLPLLSVEERMRFVLAAISA